MSKKTQVDMDKYRQNTSKDAMEKYIQDYHKELTSNMFTPIQQHSQREGWKAAAKAMLEYAKSEYDNDADYVGNLIEDLERWVDGDSK